MALPVLHALAPVADLRKTSKAFAKRGRGRKTLSVSFQSLNQSVGPLGIIRSIAFLSFFADGVPPLSTRHRLGLRLVEALVRRQDVRQFSSSRRAWQLLSRQSLNRSSGLQPHACRWPSIHSSLCCRFGGHRESASNVTGERYARSLEAPLGQMIFPGRSCDRNRQLRRRWHRAHLAVLADFPSYPRPHQLCAFEGRAVRAGSKHRGRPCQFFGPGLSNAPPSPHHQTGCRFGPKRPVGFNRNRVPISAEIACRKLRNLQLGPCRAR